MVVEVNVPDSSHYLFLLVQGMWEPIWGSVQFCYHLCQSLGVRSKAGEWLLELRISISCVPSLLFGSPSSFAFQAHDLTFMPWKEHTCCLFPSLACSYSGPGDIFSGLMQKALPD